jgi:thiamine-monophosphate kinase
VGEFDFIRWIRTTTPSAAEVLVGPGDDCAVLAAPARPLLVTTDVLTEGVDFLVRECGAFAVGRKAMAVNLSDLAAMAGTPVGAVVGVVFPRAHPIDPQELHAGLRDVADAFHCPIVGGDTNSWAGELVVSVTVFGTLKPGRQPVRRTGARPGDRLFVTGPCGGSILGRHLHPTPRLREADALAEFVHLNAMIDVSDGLSQDVSHLLAESGCGAVLTAERIPIHPDAVTLAARTGRPPLDHALGDGEDFELVFAVSEADAAKLRGGSPVPVFEIGRCVADRGLWLETGGDRRPFTPTGWSHAIG